jgi:hypothetical protein
MVSHNDGMMQKQLKPHTSGVLQQISSTVQGQNIIPHTLPKNLAASLRMYFNLHLASN